MRWQLIAVGRVRQAGLREACDHYAERIARYIRLEVREVREAGRRAPDGAAARRVEASALLHGVAPDVRLVALTPRGRTLDSEAFATRVGTWREEARDVAFVIGGAWGLDQAVIDRAELALGLGPMTLAHEVARVVLLEQIYRACTILRGEPYHK